MMRGAGGALAVTVAALLVSCSADQDTENGNEPTAERYNSAGHKAEGLGHAGVGFARQVREAGQYRFAPYLMTRRYDYVSPYSGRRWAPGYGYYGDGLPKRNFDEIDRSDLDTFVRKRNFDEIDQTAMPFPSAKRGLGLNAFAHKRNFDEIDQTLMPLPYSKRATMFRPMGGMDEIDLSEIPFSSKRSLDILRSQH